MKLRTLAEAPIFKDTHVLVRIDSDVAVVRGALTPESVYRLDCALPTLKYLLKKRAVVTVMGHRGRPQGKKIAALSLAPVQRYLEARLKTKLKFLPNTRFDAREEKNDLTYARELALDHEIFINESFATSHRAHSSTHAITKVLPSFAGLQFEREVWELSKLFAAATPLALIVGGAKFDTKVPVIEKFVKRAQHVFITGAAANAFLVAKGFRVGGSCVDDQSVAMAKKLLKHKNIVLPVDLIIAAIGGASKKFRAVALEELPNGAAVCGAREANVDVGPATLVMMSEMLVGVRTVVWNGPAGVFEHEPFHLGTERTARLLAKFGRGGAQVIAGGGETVTAIMASNMQRGFSHLSTGGGAMLAFLGGEKLPAVVALMR